MRPPSSGPPLLPHRLRHLARGQLLDLVPGRGGDEPKRWLLAQTPTWRGGVTWATLDLSGAYKAVFDAVLPEATQVADKFHVIKLANERVDETRRRVQNETLGHRGRKDDPTLSRPQDPHHGRGATGVEG